MKLKFLMLPLFSLFFVINTYAQGWEKLYHGDTIAAYFIDQTIDGGFFIGASELNTTGVNSYLIRTDVNGDTLWTRDIYNLDLLSGTKVNSGGYVLAGSFINTNRNNTRIVKINDNGDTLWTKSYEVQYKSAANSIQQTTDGGYILGGYKTSGSSIWDGDAYLIKTDVNGDTVWTKTYGASTYEVIHSVQQFL